MNAITRPPLDSTDETQLWEHYAPDRVWTVRLPRSIHDLTARIEKVTDELTLELGRPPSVSDLAAVLEIEPDEILDALEATENLGEDRLTGETVLSSLDEREREVLRLRFIDDLPQSRIATLVGCSQMDVSRLLRRTLQRLREEAG